MPLFAPSVILKSTLKSKSLYLSTVTISPPAVDSCPPEANTESSPSLISQPPVGNLSNLAPLQPFADSPSNNNFQPPLISLSVKLFFVIIGLIVVALLYFETSSVIIFTFFQIT